MNDPLKKTILVVDDSPENIDVMCGILGSDYNIKIATSGKQAINVAMDYQPDLILLDIMMPEMDGYEVCRHLKSESAVSGIPVIFVTSLNDAEDEMKGLALGAVDYLTKPVHGSIALARIKNHLELKHSRDELLELNRNLKQQVRDEVSKNMDLERLSLLGKVFDLGREGVVITNEENRIVAVNKAFSNITGYSKEDVLGNTPKIFQSGRQSADFYARLWQQLLENGFWQGEIWNRRKDGEIYPQWLSISAIHDATGKTVNYLSTFSDISEHMEVQEKIRHMALHDTLTGLPNRAAFNEQLERDIIRADRHKTKLAIVMMDLDHFKQVNDTLGHAAGDLLLTGASGRMQACLRADDFICRLGGDEFVIIMHDINSTSDAALICEKLRQSIAEPFNLNDHDTRVSLSMGIAMFPDDGRTCLNLMKNADIALYQTKVNGRNNYTFYKSQQKDLND